LTGRLTLEAIGEVFVYDISGLVLPLYT